MGVIDKISIKNAIETPAWLAVWAAEPDRRIDVRMSYNDLKTLCDLINEKRSDRWIPVEERLPEGGEEVLVQWEFYSRCDDMTYTYIHIMRLNKMTGEWNGTYGVPDGKVIAWRSLPDPYYP